MPEQSLCIKVKKIHAQKALILTREFGINNGKLEIQKQAKNINIPIVREPNKKEQATLNANKLDFEIVNRVFTKKEQRKKTIADILDDKLPSHLLAILPRSLDIIGTIAIVEIPTELEAYESCIGTAILKIHKNLRTVLAKVGAIGGTYRLRHFKHIAGDYRTKTIHKEYGCQFHVDLAKVYFSNRLSHEHDRVASLVKKGETVVDLFCGVGPFSILIAKRNANAKVFAIDINPVAIGFLKRNIRQNRVENRVIPVLGDAKQIVEDQIMGLGDRVIMNLPEKAIEFIGTACKAIKPEGGIIHYYAFMRLPNSLENLKLRFSEAVRDEGRRVEKFSFSKAFRATAPYEWQVVLDAVVK